MTSSRHKDDEDSRSAERDGGAVGQGQEDGARGGGHAKRSTEQPHPQRATHAVPSARGVAREASTAAGQLRAPQLRQHAQAPSASSEGHVEADEDAVAPGPRRTRLPPASYLKNMVERLTDSIHMEEDGEGGLDAEEEEDRKEGRGVVGEEEDGVGLVNHRGTSQFKGVWWDKRDLKW